MRLLYKTGPMESLRKWFYKPKRDDRSLLAQFFFADDALNMVAAELDSFDGRKDPERCSTLVNQLRHAQDRVLNITSQIMDQLLGDERVARGFRVKFPEDVLQDNLAGQLWFGAECLAAGSSIMNREEESASMRPLAKALTRSLETVRSLLRDQCLRPRGLALSQHDDMLHESLKIFDKLFAEFELCYVSAMVNVKTPHEFEAQQLICVLFSESLRRALKQNLLTQEQVDTYDPALMFAVPRLAIVSGLLIYSSGPLSIDKSPEDMSDMFRPFRTLLHKIRALLWTLDRRELAALERLLCTNEDVANLATFDFADTVNDPSCPYPDIGEFVSRFYADHASCRDIYTQLSSSEPTVSDSDCLLDNVGEPLPFVDCLIRLSDTEETDGPDSDHEQSKPPELSRNTESTDTFQSSERVKKTSRTETNDLSGLRNLSTNGLMMFDPLVYNALSASTSSENRQIPDHDLVTSLNEQVTEIADRLSSIAVNDVEIIEHTQMHSFSTNDVPTLISTDNEAYGYSGPRNEQLSCMPSTSHGYLIPNAISQEPAVLSSLSHNNSAVFNQEDEATNENNNPILNPDLTHINSDIDAEIVNTNISIANANLSSLLLTNEEFRQNFIDGETPGDNNSSFHSARMTLDSEEDERVKFMLGYESDHESPADSGVSTENTSLDRSPDTDQCKDLKENHFMQQNRVLKSPDGERQEDKDGKHTLESSFSDLTVNINYTEEEAQKNEAGSSSSIMDKIRLSSDEEGSTETTANVDNRRDWEANATNQHRTIDDVITQIRRHRESERMIILVEEDNTNGDRGNSSQSTSRQKKSKRSSKSKKKKSRMWSPGNVILDGRSSQNQSPLRLNLDRFVDESCADDEQIALALQAQELQARQQARGKFKSSEDLIHRLFVCIAGVADQLQTNFAADLRNILKAVFAMNQSADVDADVDVEAEADVDVDVDVEDTQNAREPAPHYDTNVDQLVHTGDEVIQNGGSFDSVYSAEEVYADSTSDSSQSDSSRVARRNTVNATTLNEQTDRKTADNTGNLQASVSTGDLTYREERRESSGPERAPEWVPDIAAPACMRCAAHFTAFRRRHHCRNCGKVFCASCSSNSIPLPRFGQLKPVRVCEECFRTTTTNGRRPQTSHR